MSSEPFRDLKNMRIWNEVHEVPGQYRKPFKIGARELTSIDPMYLISLATEQWGPIGTGWGFEILDERIQNGNHHERPEDQLHVMNIKLWYNGADDGPGAEKFFKTYGVGCTKLYMGKGDKAWIDDDYNKKTLTDAITNALSRLGFGADVRMGEFDGSKYNEREVDEDAALRKAWEQYIPWRRDKKGYSSSDPTDEMIMSKTIEFLEANTRRVTPETIRALMI